MRAPLVADDVVPGVRRVTRDEAVVELEALAEELKRGLRFRHDPARREADHLLQTQAIRRARVVRAVELAVECLRGSG